MRQSIVTCLCNTTAIATVKGAENCFFFKDTATTEIYTLSLHDALPIFVGIPLPHRGRSEGREQVRQPLVSEDRKSTRLNSSHMSNSYAVFCLKQKRGHPGRHLHGTAARGTRRAEAKLVDPQAGAHHRPLRPRHLILF